jgi:ABC-type cobalamin/Fe3+-siderophores transport system ATPase subunit
MRYLQFDIRNYKAISTPITINFRRKSLFPIIGINESGKTTVLHAVFAFDHYNDDLNDNGRHLRDTANLYRTAPDIPHVAATIACTRPELNSALRDVEASADVALKAAAGIWRRKRQLPEELVISRNLKDLRYTIETPPFADSPHANSVAEAVLSHLPYILFFDDFRDRVDEKIEIPQRNVATGWLAILQQLFKQTDPSLSVFALSGMEERQRKSTLAKVQRHLNNTLTKEWQNFRLDDSDALEIGLEYVPAAEGATNRGHLKLGACPGNHCVS